MDAREKDIQAICTAILDFGIQDTGDYGSGGRCPFCYIDCNWNAEMKEIEHSANCVYLIAKDLSTNNQNKEEILCLSCGNSVKTKSSDSKCDKCRFDY